jgi:hypothetical protein
MKTSESIGGIAKALSKFQGEVKDTFKGKKGYGYTYAPIDEVLKQVRPLMSSNGLSHVQSQTFDTGVMTVQTRIMHESGEWIETTAQSPFAQMKGMNDYQSAGSGITYLRRYGLAAALGIASDEDADAHGEQERQKTPPPSKASDVDKKAAWSNFSALCTQQGVDPQDFLASQIDMDDKNAVYGVVRKWLTNEQLLRDQLIVFKNQ